MHPSPPTARRIWRRRWPTAPATSTSDKLLRRHARGMKLSDKLVADAVKRAEGVSAAFIKELMRRVAQAVVSRGEAG